MKKINLIGFVLVLLIAWPLSATALTYSTSASYTHYVDTTSTTITDNDAGPPLPVDAEVTTTNGVTLASVIGLENKDAIARAEFNGLGYSSVLADGVLWNPEGDGPDTLTAAASMTDTFTNTSSSAVSITYDFFLSEIQLAIGDWAGAGSGNPLSPNISYSMEIEGNGVTVWSSSALLEGGKLGHTLSKSGEDLGGTYFADDPLSPNYFGYDFDAFADILDLGVVDPGDSYSLIATLAVSVVTGPFELGGRAGFVDPGEFGFGGTLSGTGAPVPEPATILLLGSGWIGLVGLWRKRK